MAGDADPDRRGAGIADRHLRRDVRRERREKVGGGQPETAAVPGARPERPHGTAEAGAQSDWRGRINRAVGWYFFARDVQCHSTSLSGAVTCVMHDRFQIASSVHPLPLIRHGLYCFVMGRRLELPSAAGWLFTNQRSNAKTRDAAP